MPIQIAVALLICVSSLALAADTPLSYKEARKVWEQTRDRRKEYQTYAAEFAQFNNHFRLDEKGDCYALDQRPVELMLVITHKDKEQYASIEQVLSSVDHAKAQCFRKSYGGIRTKIPPFFSICASNGHELERC